MNNNVEFVAPAHSLLMKAEMESSTHQESKNRVASIQASPQAAHKKRFTKFDISMLVTTWSDNIAPTHDEITRQMTTKKSRHVTPHGSRDRSATQPPGIASVMIEKPMTIASLNVRGLRGDTHKPKKLKAWMASLSPPPQILLIQEHHLGKEGIKSTTKGIEFWQGTSFWNEGIPMGTSQKTSADTTMLVDKSTTLLVKDHGIVMEGRTQFVTL